MSGSGRNWRKATDRQRRHRALADSMAIDRHCQAIAAALTGQVRLPGKADLRAEAAAAVAKYPIQRLQPRRRCVTSPGSGGAGYGKREPNR
jgi:hypothetical protein